MGEAVMALVLLFLTSAPPQLAAEGENPQNYICKEWVNCMPGIGSPDPDREKYCSRDYEIWAQGNCDPPPVITQ